MAQLTSVGADERWSVAKPSRYQPHGQLPPRPASMHKKVEAGDLILGIRRSPFGASCPIKQVLKEIAKQRTTP